jgi:hypothetical protein
LREESGTMGVDRLRDYKARAREALRLHDPKFTTDNDDLILVVAALMCQAEDEERDRWQTQIQTSYSS